MSDTPRTDAFVKAYWASEEDNRPRWSDFARGLELEVSLLRKRILDDNKAYGCELRDPSGTIWDNAKRLQHDNAALRADKERLDERSAQ